MSTRLIENFDYPVGWKAVRDGRAWRVLRADVPVGTGFGPARFWRVFSDEDVGRVPKLDFYDENDFFARVSDAVDAAAFEAWRRECPPRTIDALGTIGALAMMVASDCGEMIRPEWAVWPTREQVVAGDLP